VGWTAVVLAAGFAAWAGTQYASASASPASSPGQVRDAALAAGTRGLADLNSVSAKNIPAGEKRWLADTTGAEHTKIAETNSAAAAQIAKVKTSSAATVTAAALTAFSAPAAGGSASQSGAQPGGQSSAPAGTARMIATVSVVQTNASGVTNTVVNRYQVTLTLTSAGWKISSLTGG
jgi:Mce-associated membrane protein